MSLPSLFVLAHEYRATCDKLADLDLDVQTIADTLEGMAGDLEVKAQNVAMFVLNLEATAEAIKAHERLQAERRRAIENRAESLRDYLQNCMEATGIEKIEGPGIVIGFRSSSAVVIHEPALVPLEYMRTPKPLPAAPDKDAIAAAIKAGADIPGAHIKHRRNLSIK